jgi:hypothetical protein
MSEMVETVGIPISRTRPGRPSRQWTLPPSPLDGTRVPTRIRLYNTVMLCARERAMARVWKCVRESLSPVTDFDYDPVHSIK